MPPARPLWALFEKDEKIFGVENAHLLGNSILAHPIMEENANSVDIYLPGENRQWLNLQTKTVFNGGQQYTLPVTLETIPYFQLE